MMKNLYFLLFALLAVSSFSYAKTTGVSIPNIFPHYGSGGTSNAPIIPGATKSRIIAQTFLTFDGAGHTPIDSITYTYSSGRGGQLADDELNDNFVSFDESITYLFNPTLNTYRNQFHRQQTFNLTNKVQAYTCRSWVESTNMWRDSSKFLYTYNSDQSKLLKTIFQIWYGGIWADHVTYNNVFDVVGNITDMNSNVFKMHFDYNATNDLVQRTDKQWSPTLSWHLTDRYTFTYDATHRITSYTIEVYNNGWQNSEQYVYTYSGSDHVITEVSLWNNNAWELSGKHLFTYDNNHNKLADDWQVWNAATSSFIPSTILRWTYNTFSQPLTYSSQTWDASAAAWTYAPGDFLYRYYYQSYIPTPVKEVTPFAAKVLLFPQPARDVLNISLSEDTHQPYTISVVDVQGRLLKHLESSKTHEVISVACLPAGNYFLSIRNQDNTIARQFVVTH
jgi:hypothetical protein